MEIADCFMLLLDSAHHVGITHNEILQATKEKLEINKKRKWGNPDENGVVEHIKSFQPPEPITEEEIEDMAKEYAKTQPDGFYMIAQSVFIVGAKAIIEKLKR